MYASLKPGGIEVLFYRENTQHGLMCSTTNIYSLENKQTPFVVLVTKEANLRLIYERKFM